MTGKDVDACVVSVLEGKTLKIVETILGEPDFLSPHEDGLAPLSCNGVDLKGIQLRYKI